ncbi:hypothetical protein EDF38_2790 [Frigoribacterium sp. PhB160]|nr:hypothetical protein EDF38_2790 [Frigoribacterium sp. PhB160]
MVGAVVAVGIPANAAWTLPTLPDRDREAWTMPLDQYVSVGQIELAYAQELMLEPCMAETTGADATVPWRDVDAAAYAAERQPIRAFDLADARERGYHVPETTDPGEAAWREFQLRQTSAAETTARDACLDELYSQHPELLSGALGSFTGSVSDVAIRLSNAAFLAAREDDAVLATVPAWTECMAGAAAVTGFPLAATPAGMPTPEMAAAFASSDPTTRVSDEEIALAGSDALCRESSGYLDALYDAEWRRQLTVPHDYGERLAQVDTGAVAAAKETVARALTRLTPERP